MKNICKHTANISSLTATLRSPSKLSGADDCFEFLHCIFKRLLDFFNDSIMTSTFLNTV